MNRIMSFLGLSLAALFGGCGAAPTSHDVVGTWTNSDGGQLTIQENGQFSARSLPRKVFWWHEPGPPLEGKGTWKLEKGKPYWEVKLSFKEVSAQPASLGLSVLVSGSGDSTYLYQWVGEEGEARYKLERKSPAAH